MSKLKIITVSIPENDADEILPHYLNLGFSVIKSSLLQRTNDSGDVLETFYEYHLKFDFGQKNADKLWASYKNYKKKTAELERLEAQSNRAFCISAKFFIVPFVIAIILLPFIPMLFGNDFFDFTHEVGFLFDLEKEFDLVLFLGSVAIGYCTGLIVSILAEVIGYFLFRDKRMLLAIDRLPVAEAERDALIADAAKLKG